MLAVSHDRDRDVSRLPSASTASGTIEADLEAHARRMFVGMLRKIAAAFGWSSAGIGIGAGVVAFTADDDTPASSAPSIDSGPEPEARGVPKTLLLPPASDYILDGCERAGEDARRAIQDARLCVDSFTRAELACQDAHDEPEPPSKPRKH